MANESRGTILNFIAGNIVPVAVVLTVFLLFVPIPKFIIDLSMILNLAFAIIILLVVVRIPRPSDFQTFPRVILFQTLFSLGINISAWASSMAPEFKRLSISKSFWFIESKEKRAATSDTWPAPFVTTRT